MTALHVFFLQERSKLTDFCLMDRKPSGELTTVVNSFADLSRNAFPLGLALLVVLFIFLRENLVMVFV